jgi:subtilisin family serine protease
MQSFVISILVFFSSFVAVLTQPIDVHIYPANESDLSALSIKKTPNNSSGESYNPGYLMVRLNPGTTVFDLQNSFSGIRLVSVSDKMNFSRKVYDGKLRENNDLAERRYRLMESIKDIYYLFPKSFSQTDLTKLAKDLTGSGMVRYAEFPQVHYTNVVEESGTDPLLDAQRYFGPIGMNPYDLQLPDASDIIVAIVDSGTDTDHEDLEENIYINIGEIPGNGLDDDDNGYIDDVSGWDFVGDVDRDDIRSGEFMPDNDPAPTGSSNNHGTHVAGCVSAVNFNNVGVASPGRGAKLLPIKIGPDSDTNSGLYNTYEGILYASYMGADIINCSWGGSGFSEYEWDIIRSVDLSGSIIIASAGNDLENNDLGYNYPNNFPEVISVGAAVNGDRPANFSNYGIDVDVFAPGVDILSTGNNGVYYRSSGTSMSSPIVSGMAAVALAAKPDLSRAELRALLRYTASDYTDFEQDDEYFGIANMDGLLREDMYPTPAVIKRQIQNEVLKDETFDIGIYPVNGIVNDLSFEITPVEDFLEFETINEFVPMLDDTIVYTETFDVTEDSPWYKGSTYLGIYSDFDEGEAVDSYRLDFLADSNGSVSIFQDWVNGSRIAWRKTKRYGDDLWFMGIDLEASRGILYNLNTDEEYLFGEFYITDFHQYPNGDMIFAASNDGELVISTDTFETIETLDYSSMVNNLQGMVAYDNGDIVIIGRPNSPGRNIQVINTDRSASFTEVNQISELLDGSASVFTECIDYEDNIIAFADTRGRLVYSFNSGNTWQVMEMPERYPHRLTLGHGSLAVLASSDRRREDIPTLYEISLDDLELGEPNFFVTEAANMPEILFYNYLSFNAPVGMEYIVDGEGDRSLAFAGAQGELALKRVGANKEFQFIRNSRWRDYRISHIESLNEGSNFGRVYYASNFIRALTFPMPGSDIDQDYLLNGIIYSADDFDNLTQISDSTIVGQREEIRIPFRVSSSSDAIYITPLDIPFRNDLVLEEYPDGWYMPGETDTIVFSFLPEDIETVAEVMTLKTGESIHTISLTLESQWPVSVKEIPTIQSQDKPYYSGDMIFNPKQTYLTLYDLNGGTIAQQNSDISTSGLSKGVYFLRAGGNVYKLMVK